MVAQNELKENAVQRTHDDLIHAMVHDLRTPLTVLSGILQMIENKSASAEDLEEMVTLAQRNVDRMLALVNDILEINRLESGQVPLQRSWCDLEKMAAQVLRGQRPLAQKRQLCLKHEAGPSVPPVWADAALVERVLQNLIGNAIKFTTPAGTIGVCVTRVDQEVKVAVSDTGPGIPPYVEERLFQKFVRGAEEERGSGLGLAYCRMAVEAHGGRIWVETKPGVGSTFTFSLPITEEEEVLDTLENR